MSNASAPVIKQCPKSLISILFKKSLSLMVVLLCR